MDEATEARIRELEERVRQLEQRAAAPPSPPRPLAPPPAPPAPPVAAPSPPPRFTPAATRAARPKRDLESFLGANWLARAGVLVLALGVVFFLKLAFDNDWIGLPARIALGVVGGLALAVTGDALRTRRIDPAFSQVITGGGFVIAYVSVYMAYALPEYRAALRFSLGLDLAFLTILAAGLGAYAWWRNLPILASVAIALSTLLLGPAGDVTTAGLLYSALLCGALLAAAALRGWGHVALWGLVAGNAVMAISLAADVDANLVAGTATVFNAVAVAAAYRARSLDGGGVGALLLLGSVLAVDLLYAFALFWGFAPWGAVVGIVVFTGLILAVAILMLAQGRPATATNEALLPVALIFTNLILFMTLVQDAQPWGASLGAILLDAGAVWAVARPTVPERGARVTAALAPFALAAVLATALVEGRVADALAWSALGVGLAAAASAFLLRRVASSLGIAGAILLLAWPALHFENQPAAALAWCAEAGVALLLAAQLMRARNALHAGALAASALALTQLFQISERFGFVKRELPAALGFFALVLLLAGALWWLRSREGLQPRLLHQAALGVAILSPIVLLGYFLAGWGIAVGWAVVALMLVAGGIVLADREVRLAAFGVFGLVLGRIFLVDFSALNLASRVLTFILTGAVLLAASYLYARGKKEKKEPAPTAGTPVAPEPPRQP